MLALSVLSGKAVCDLRYGIFQVATAVVMGRTFIEVASRRPERGGAKVVVLGKQGVAAGGGFYALGLGADEVPLMPSNSTISPMEKSVAPATKTVKSMFGSCFLLPASRGNRPQGSTF